MFYSILTYRVKTQGPKMSLHEGTAGVTARDQVAEVESLNTDDSNSSPRTVSNCGLGRPEPVCVWGALTDARLGPQRRDVQPGVASPVLSHAPHGLAGGARRDLLTTDDHESCASSIITALGGPGTGQLGPGARRGATCQENTVSRRLPPPPARHSAGSLAALPALRGDVWCPAPNREARTGRTRSRSRPHVLSR